MRTQPSPHRRRKLPFRLMNFSPHRNAADFPPEFPELERAMGTFDLFHPPPYSEDEDEETPPVRAVQSTARALRAHQRPCYVCSESSLTAATIPLCSHCARHVQYRRTR